MAREPGNPEDVSVPVMRRLVKETGITEAEAQDLVVLVGINWSSLVREARLLRRIRSKP